MTTRLRVSLSLLLVWLSGCDASIPSSWRLPAALSEVSGLAAVDGQLLLHEDESGVVYRLDPNTGAIRQVFRIDEPPIRADFEGIAVRGSDVLLVTSDGQLHTVTGSIGHEAQVVKSEVTDLGLKEVCEIEGFDVSGQDLLFACKENYQQSQDRLLIYRYRGGQLEPLFDISLADVGRFKPSALATSQKAIYVLSAKPPKLLTLDVDGSIVGARSLKKLGLPQPEGLALIDNRLYVASEKPGGGLVKRLIDSLE